MEKKQPLKKFFILLAIWVVAIGAVFAGAVIYDRYQAVEYDIIAVPYIRDIIPKLSQWDPATTKALMAPDISSTIPDENFVKAMTLFSRLGALQSTGTPKFDNVQENLITDIGTLTIVEYDIDAKYEHGDAVINLKLLKDNDSYQIYRFNFGSEILMD